MTVDEVSDLISDDLQEIAAAFLLSEDEFVTIGVEVSLPPDPVRCAYGDAAQASDRVWMIDRQNIAVSNDLPAGPCHGHPRRSVASLPYSHEWPSTVGHEEQRGCLDGCARDHCSCLEPTGIDRGE